MNKFLIVVVAFAVVAVSAQGPFGQKLAQFMKYADECKAETGATDEDLKSMMSANPTEKLWCLTGCINKKSGVMSADNKLVMDKFEAEMAPIKEQKPEIYEKIMSAVKQCKPDVESKAANLATPCAASKALGECLKTKM